MRHPAKWVTIATVVALVGLSACGSSGSKPSSASSPSTTSSGGGAPHRGGNLTVLVPSGEWPNLDPAHDTQDTADAALLNSIFGGLFQFGAKGQPIPDEASGYKFVNGGMAVDISLRHGVTFSDGTPMTADDVAWSITRALDPKNACICDADFAAVKSVTASGPDTVVLTLSRPFWAIIQAFSNTAPNWIVDKAALDKMGGNAYEQAPVAAGPFKVVSNKASTTLQLTANPTYWDAAHHPYVKNLTFTSVGTDQSAYSAIQAGQAQAASAVTSIPLVSQLESQPSSSIRVIAGPATTYQFVSLNDKAPPFNNIVAREALYYATDANALVKSLYKGLYKVVESPTASGSTFYLPTIPGYRTYDLAKAKSLVKQLGGLHVDLATTTNSQYFETEVTALKSMWAQAGIQTTIVFNNLEQTLNQLRSGSWQALDSNWGGVDPAFALPTYFKSDGPFTGIHDPTLDHLIDEAAATKAHDARLALYKQVAQRMNTQAEVPFLYEKPFFTVASSAVQGISSAQYPPYWEDAWLKK